MVWMWLCPVKLALCKMPQSGHSTGNKLKQLIRVSAVPLPPAAPSHSTWAGVTCVVPACGFCLFFPTPRRFILRLESSKAFLCCPAANSAPLLIIWHTLPAVLSIIKSWKWLCNMKSFWVSFDLIYTSVNQKWVFGCDFCC